MKKLLKKQPPAHRAGRSKNCRKYLLMFATDIRGQIVLTTSTHQMILFKYAKGISRKLNSAWQARRFWSKILRLLRVGNENMMAERNTAVVKVAITISTNVHHTVFLGKQIKAIILFKTAADAVIMGVLWCK